MWARSSIYIYDVHVKLWYLLQEKKYEMQVEELKEDVKRLIHAETDVPLAKLELLDSVQRLGLNYQFQKDIKQAIDRICEADSQLGNDLHSTALLFRILREHGYTVSQGLSCFTLKIVYISIIDYLVIS